MPRFTIWPRRTSAAARRTISSRDQLMRARFAPVARGAELDDVPVLGHVDDPLHEQRRAGGRRRDRCAPSSHQLVDLGDGQLAAAVAISGLKLRAVR